MSAALQEVAAPAATPGRSDSGPEYARIDDLNRDPFPEIDE